MFSLLKNNETPWGFLKLLIDNFFAAQNKGGAKELVVLL
jgi:hypothetical protein